MNLNLHFHQLSKWLLCNRLINDYSNWGAGWRRVAVLSGAYSDPQVGEFILWKVTGQVSPAGRIPLEDMVTSNYNRNSYHFSDIMVGRELSICLLKPRLLPSYRTDILQGLQMSLWMKNSVGLWKMWDSLLKFIILFHQLEMMILVGCADVHRKT